MVRIPVFVLAIVLAGCTDNDEPKRNPQKAADQSALQGQFKPSEPLDYSKYAEPAKPMKPVPHTPVQKQKFKKSPPLNYLKYVQGGAP